MFVPSLFGKMIMFTLMYKWLKKTGFLPDSGSACGQVTPVERYRDDTRGVDLPVRAIIVAPL